MTFGEGYRLDILVENQIIYSPRSMQAIQRGKLKACDKYNPVWYTQLLIYLNKKKSRLNY